MKIYIAEHVNRRHYDFLFVKTTKNQSSL